MVFDQAVKVLTSYISVPEFDNYLQHPVQLLANTHPNEAGSDDLSC